jgi:hypothetical protein
VPKPNMLLLDVETQPDLVWVWSVYESSAIDVKEHWQLLSFSAKWLGTKVHVTKGLPDYAGYKPGGDDGALVRDLWKLLDEADIVIGHNAVDFDCKKINARFIAHGLRPPSPYQIIDTKRAVKKVAGFSSNKLDWLCRQLDLGKKLEHQGWQLWKGCMVGEPAAWRTMLKYNRYDVVLLERLYKLLAPWIRQPNGALWDSGERCTNPNCRSTRLQKRGIQRMKTRVYQRFQCRDCGAWAKSVLSERTPRAVVAPV